MPVTVNVRHLEDRSVRLRGELPVGELDLDLRDEIVRVEQPLIYDLEVQKLDKSLLIQGRLELRLQCECVRCLKPFESVLELKDWTRHVPLEGDDRVQVADDCVDLTPYVREDILLEFPQHPLCETNCGGLSTSYEKPNKAGDPAQAGPQPTAWAELDKLKF